eukprot:GHVO01005853.1.p1 GENE.GHVO01005853.1~~GHVO01005853.1.p1  ORF type:complete len:315 (+),score=47.55 GHVO01005853.1:526-1470(+)
MISQDWLPFISRLLHYGITCTCLDDKEGEAGPWEWRVNGAFLLCEYPGYGKSDAGSEVQATPHGCTASALRAIGCAVNRLSLNDKANVDLHVVGYSLGAAVGLRVAHEIAAASVTPWVSDTPPYSPRSNRERVMAPPLRQPRGDVSIRNGGGVRLRSLTLLSPFTSITDCASKLIGISEGSNKATFGILNALTSDSVKWDNRDAIKYLMNIVATNQRSIPRFRLRIIHSINDITIPVHMGIELFDIANGIIEKTNTGHANDPSVEYIPLKGVTHQNMLNEHQSCFSVYAAMATPSASQVDPTNASCEFISRLII